VTPVALSDSQRAIVERSPEGRVFLEGSAGTGKTTVGVARMIHLLAAGVPAGAMVVFVPQRTLGAPYTEAFSRASVRAGGQVTILTVGGLARRMVDLFWPLVAEEAGFGHPDDLPTFLTLETAQYEMARLVRPLLEEEGYFESITIDRNRLYSQIIDNLNKAAVVGFPHTEIGERLIESWGGEEAQQRVYEQAQICASRFRDYCLAHNLLDFSLQMEVFRDYLWPMGLCRNYLLESYRHLIVDNVEEDTPVAHDLLRDWLEACRSALVIYDRGAGYRQFLGADIESARALAERCDERVTFETSFVTSADLRAFGRALARSLGALEASNEPDEAGRSGNARAALRVESRRYYPQMLDWATDQVASLIHEEDVPPGEIVMLAPFLPDSLRFSLQNRLAAREVLSRSHRPSRALRDEPATQCLLTLAALAHPDWGCCPGGFDVAYALMQAIGDLDLVRAQLLTQIVYRPTDGRPELTSFDQIKPEVQERLTFALGERYERLRRWLVDYTESSAAMLDHFLSRLFGQILSQPGFGFHRDPDSGEVSANLIESVRKFRWVMGERWSPHRKPLGQEYIEMVEDGVIAAQYVYSWQRESEGTVLLAPAYTFLMRNRPVDYQVWLDVGSRGWWERLYQPLTHPYVLSRSWPRGETWTDAHEIEARTQTLSRVARGLVNRCRCGVYLGLSELGEHGREQKGPLLQAIQRVLRDLPQEKEAVDGV